jgi:hypothetical protein
MLSIPFKSRFQTLWETKHEDFNIIVLLLFGNLQPIGCMHKACTVSIYSARIPRYSAHL